MSRRRVKAERKRSVARRVNAARVEAEAVDDRKAKAIADLMWTIVNSSAYLIDDIRAALTHCPRGIAAIGRVLEIGGRARGVVGPSDDQTATLHLEHAIDHVRTALADPAAVADTGELESAHAGARCALAVELVERGRR